MSIETVDAAVVAKLVWKSGRMRDYAAALLRAALDLDGLAFNNDDVPDADQPLDKTTVGAVFRMLAGANVIKCAERTRKSSRAGCRGHRNLLWYLTNKAIARAWLKANGLAPRERLDLFDFAATTARSQAAEVLNHGDTEARRP